MGRQHGSPGFKSRSRTRPPVSDGMARLVLVPDPIVADAPGNGAARTHSPLAFRLARLRRIALVAAYCEAYGQLAMQDTGGMSRESLVTLILNQKGNYDA
jgi:hypothetical protein